MATPPKYSPPETRMVEKPPVVVILGHVDHGKTSILDKIRQTKVAEKEAGGITQHIGAYQVEHSLASSGQVKKITFLDTPGHEAFTAIRSRGAKAADIAVLVVAANEGIKPQTKEVISILKNSETPFIVAINKIDKEDANPAKVRQELAENEIMVEDYGGKIPVVEISARSGAGINELLEMILLVAEMEELKSPLSTPAKGVVIESHLDSKRGNVATLIVQEGELKTGDWVAAGRTWGLVKLMEDFTGRPIKIAIASQPCLTLGWEEPPSLGEKFEVMPNRRKAQESATEKSKIGPSPLFVNAEGAEENNKKVANLIIKADVLSSLEAIDQALQTISSPEVGYKVVDFGIGQITDTDIKKAAAVEGIILGFHTAANGAVKKTADRENIKILLFDVIYEITEAVRLIMSDLLEPEIKRNDLGKLKVLAIFKSAGRSQIIGGKVVQGKIVRGAMADVIRNSNPLIKGRIAQLQHNKADVTEVTEGLEAGIKFELAGTDMPINIREDDVLEIYQEEKIKREL